MGCNKAYYLNLDDHPLGSIINIAIGKIASTEVNVDEALQTGESVMDGADRKLFFLLSAVGTFCRRLLVSHDRIHPQY